MTLSRTVWIGAALAIVAAVVVVIAVFAGGGGTTGVINPTRNREPQRSGRELSGFRPERPGDDGAEEPPVESKLPALWDQLGRMGWRLRSGVSQRRKRTTAQLVSQTCAAITARTCFHDRPLVAVGSFAGVIRGSATCDKFAPRR